LQRGKSPHPSFHFAAEMGVTGCSLLILIYKLGGEVGGENIGRVEGGLDEG